MQTYYNLELGIKTNELFEISYWTRLMSTFVNKLFFFIKITRTEE